MWWIKNGLSPETRRRIRDGIVQLSPWYQPIDFGQGLTARARDKNGKTYSPHNLDRGIRKWHRFIKPALPCDLKGKVVLECGCNAGLFLVQSCREGAVKTFGIEIDEHYRRQALFVRDTFSEIDGKDYPIEIFRSSFDEFDYKKLGTVDVVFFLNTIYHIGRVTVSDGSAELITAIQADMLKRVAAISKYIVFQANPLEDGGRGKGRQSLLNIIEAAGLTVVKECVFNHPRGLIVSVKGSVEADETGV